MLALIWTSAKASEWLFLIAAILFAVEAILIIAKAPYHGALLAIGACLVALGFLALP